jgi:hypothetical protein
MFALGNCFLSNDIHYRLLYIYIYIYIYIYTYWNRIPFSLAIFIDFNIYLFI